MRKTTWDTDLMNFVASRGKTPFEWGAHDCTLFAADCAQVITGTDPAAKYRGTYKDEAGATAIIKPAGSLRQLVTSNIGPEIPPKLVQRGDWVMIYQGGQEALAVCLGLVAVAAGQGGLVFRPITDAVTAWRIN